MFKRDAERSGVEKQHYEVGKQMKATLRKVCKLGQMT
jgi:hypothetical protein